MLTITGEKLGPCRPGKQTNTRGFNGAQKNSEEVLTSMGGEKLVRGDFWVDELVA